MKSRVNVNVFKGDTVYDNLNGSEIQFKDSLSASAALNSYLNKQKREKMLNDSFDNLMAKHKADVKAYTDSVNKCHTYQ